MIRRWFICGENPIWPLAIRQYTEHWLPRSTDVLQVRTTVHPQEIQDHCLAIPGGVVLWEHQANHLDAVVDTIRRLDGWSKTLQFAILPETIPLSSPRANDMSLLYRELGATAAIQTAGELARLAPCVRRFWESIVPADSDDLQAIWAHLPWRE